MRIAVAGATGVVGRYVVQAATAGGHDVIAMSRRTGVDLSTGKGLGAALEGVEAIVDASNFDTTNGARAKAFFTEATGRLQRVGSTQGVSRLVTLSIVGLERAEGYGYYEAKLAHEAAALAGPLRATVVRATQFHEFPAQILKRARFGPLALIPVMRVQTVAARSVGEVLVEVATTEPSSGQTTATEIAGPEQSKVADLARAILAKLGIRSSVVSLPIPGAAGRAMREGALLPSRQARIVGPRFAEWLTGDDLAVLFS
ncbi:MAG: SDR family oxidoreductase [Acidimicrobiales bacterium]